MPDLSRRSLVVAAAAMATATTLARPALAQARYPQRPVTLICPWGAGGGTDATARIVAAVLEKELGQPFNVVNRTGGFIDTSFPDFAGLMNGLAAGAAGADAAAAAAAAIAAGPGGPIRRL